MTTFGFVFLTAADELLLFAAVMANELIDETVKSRAIERAVVKILLIFIDISPG